ncbi:hypothetical protein [Absidia glauca]|uniref:Uncharacterized protein n=1 Tax=Absidia glauca TaxID=4829 RepID=A0A168N481_ABSGL|nr:hypothetical protein [Absidia glauca]
MFRRVVIPCHRQVHHYFPMSWCCHQQRLKTRVVQANEWLEVALRSLKGHVIPESLIVILAAVNRSARRPKRRTIGSLYLGFVAYAVGI